MTVQRVGNVYSQWKIFSLNALLVHTIQITTSHVNHVQRVESAQFVKNNTSIIIQADGFLTVISHLMVPT